jgi:hypothetical protein
LFEIAQCITFIKIPGNKPLSSNASSKPKRTWRGITIDIKLEQQTESNSVEMSIHLCHGRNEKKNRICIKEFHNTETFSKTSFFNKGNAALNF